MGALYSVIDPATGKEVEQRWFPKGLDPDTYVSDPDNPGGKRYMVLLDGNAPEPATAQDELDGAIADAIKDEVPNSPVRKLGEALLGQAGRAGRIAGRPV